MQAFKGIIKEVKEKLPAKQAEEVLGAYTLLKFTFGENFLKFIKMRNILYGIMVQYFENKKSIIKNAYLMGSGLMESKTNKKDTCL